VLALEKHHDTYTNTKKYNSALYFCKVGRIAYENVVTELLKAKCLLSLYYGLEACPININ